jgi:pyridoxal phosphate enzyme (YggS family)
MTEKSSAEKRCEDITENLKRVRGNIENAAAKCGRDPKDIKLMAVTKTVEPVFINHAIDCCGVDLIGENRVQEYFSKKDELHLDGVDVHLIGHLQTNKVSSIIPEVSLIHSVDSIKLANCISKESVKLGITTNVLFECNIGKEESKTGFLYEQIPDACAQASEMPGISVCGLMAVPPMQQDETTTRSYFAEMYKLFVDIQDKKIDNINMNILSLGMSSDYEWAVAEGSTLVRVGTSIFGPRIYY